MIGKNGLCSEDQQGINNDGYPRGGGEGCDSWYGIAGGPGNVDACGFMYVSRKCPLDGARWYSQ